MMFRYWFRSANVILLLSVSVLLMPRVSCAGDPIAGLRLFLTEEQRERLDRKRSGVEEVAIPVVVDAPKPKPKPKPKPPLPQVTLQGYVVRGDGENTVWVNNRALEEGQSAEKKVKLLSVDNLTGDAHINMPDQSTISLKPGQRFEPKGKKVVDPVN